MPTGSETPCGRGIDARLIPTVLAQDPSLLDRQAARARGVQMERVVARLVHPQPTRKTQGIAAFASHGVEGETRRRPGAREFGGVELLERPHSTAILGHLQRSRYVCVAKQVVRDIRGLDVGERHRRHSAGRARREGIPQELPQPIERPFLDDARERCDRVRVGRRVLGRVTRHATAAVIQPLAAGDRGPVRHDSTERHRCGRQQVVRERLRCGGPIGRRLDVQHVRHRRPGHRLVRRREVALEPLAGHPGPNSGEPRPRLRGKPRRLFTGRGVARGAVQFAKQHAPGGFAWRVSGGDGPRRGRRHPQHETHHHDANSARTCHERRLHPGPSRRRSVISARRARTRHARCAHTSRQRPGPGWP